MGPFDNNFKKIAWSGHSDSGRYRLKNQDRFIALKVDGEGAYHLGKKGNDSLEQSNFVFAVSDGMGGANAGDFASRAVVEQISILFPSVCKIQAQGVEVCFQNVLMELVSNLHTAISNMGSSYKELDGMGATLSMLWVRAEQVYFAHIGDSRIYHLTKKGDFNQITKDDTHIAWLKEKGAISDYEARNDPRRNILQQVIGGKTQHLNPQFGELVLNDEDRFLICSDGLNEGLMDSTIKRMMIEAETITTLDLEMDSFAEKMVNQSVSVDGKDNTTALCIQIN